MNPQELFEKSKKLIPGGVHSPDRSFKGMEMPPRFIEKADGAYIWDNSFFTLSRIAEYDSVAEINKADMIFVEEGFKAGESFYVNESTIVTLNTEYGVKQNDPSY